MIGALPGEAGYDWLLFAHILLAVVGGGAAFALAVIGSRTGAAEGDTRTFGLRMSAAVDQILVNPALWVTGGLGIVLVLIGDPWEFSQTWISIAFALWIIGVGIGTFVLRPAGLKAVAASERGDADDLAAQEKKLAMFGGINHLVLVLLILDMVFKPGL